MVLEHGFSKDLRGAVTNVGGARIFAYISIIY